MPSNPINAIHSFKRKIDNSNSIPTANTTPNATSMPVTHRWCEATTEYDPRLASKQPMQTKRIQTTKRKQSLKCVQIHECCFPLFFLRRECVSRVASTPEHCSLTYASLHTTTYRNKRENKRTRACTIHPLAIFVQIAFLLLSSPFKHIHTVHTSTHTPT
jgi:hypothetical protein